MVGAELDDRFGGRIQPGPTYLG